MEGLESKIAEFIEKINAAGYYGSKQYMPEFEALSNQYGQLKKDQHKEPSIYEVRWKRILSIRHFTTVEKAQAYMKRAPCPGGGSILPIPSDSIDLQGWARVDDDNGIFFNY